MKWSDFIVNGGVHQHGHTGIGRGFGLTWESKIKRVLEEIKLTLKDTDWTTWSSESIEDCRLKLENLMYGIEGDKQRFKALKDDLTAVHEIFCGF